MDPEIGTPAAQVAPTYVRSVEGTMTGQILDVGVLTEAAKTPVASRS